MATDICLYAEIFFFLLASDTRPVEAMEMWLRGQVHKNNAEMSSTIRFFSFQALLP